VAEKIEFDIKVPKNDLGKALDEGVKKSTLLESSLSTALGVFTGGLVLKGFDAIIGSFGSLVDVAGKAIAAAAGQEVATNNLNNALLRAGNYTRQASEDLAEYATQLQNLTIYEDDAVLGNLALLQSLTKLNTEGLKQGVSAASDFATVLGIDLETATRLVAKAAVGQTEAFKRYGVEIEKGSSNTESFNNTIEALTRQFGGAAKSQLSTFTGSLTALENAYGDLLEPIGDIIVKNPMVVATFNEVRKVIIGATNDATNATTAFQEFTNDALFYSASVAEIFADSLTFIRTAIDVLVSSINIVGSEILRSFVTPLENGINVAIEFGKALDGVSGFFNTLENPIAGASKALSDFTDQSKAYLDSTLDFSSGTLSDTIRDFTNSIIDSSAEVSIAQKEALTRNAAKVTNEIDTNAQILAERAKLNNELLLLQTQLANEETKIAQDLYVANQEDGLAKNQLAIEAKYAQALAEAEAVLQGQLAEAAVIEDAESKKIAQRKAYEAEALAAKKAQGAKILALQQAQSADEKKNQQSFFDSAISLSSAKNKEIAAIGKAAALTQLAIKTPEAIANSFAFGTKLGGPILGFALGGIAATAMAAQAANIAGVGFEKGGIVGQTGGASVGPDNRTANIRDGEMVLNGPQQKQLFDALSSGSFGGGNIQVIIDGREIAVAVRNQIQSGFRIN